MKSLKIKPAQREEEIRYFESMLLNDLSVLQKMIDDGRFKDRVHRIGIEQEFCIVDESFKAANANQIILKKLNDPLFATELAKFNIELNSPPIEFSGDCLQLLENFLLDKFQTAVGIAKKEKLHILMAGILPTIRKFDLTIENITPSERYFALVKALGNMRGKEFELRIQGIDELIMKYDSAFLESATTSFQTHLQVHPDEFAEIYNITQLIAAPILSCAVNSPVLFRKKLWAETRVALFQQSVDTRQIDTSLRNYPARVNFGKQWVKNGITEIYHEDVTFHRVLLTAGELQNAAEALESGDTPQLQALQTHNSTIYRWNRPCYGMYEGEPILRIENRILPAGPTIADQMANASFWFGLIFGIQQTYPNFQTKMHFEDARNNFILAARNGLQNVFKWLNQKNYSAQELILKELLPLAKEGLALKKIQHEQIDHFLSIIEERVQSGKTGAQWIINFSQSKQDHLSEEEIQSTIAATSHYYQLLNQPIHTWTMDTMHALKDWNPASMVVEECMSTTLFALKQTDIIQMASDMMEWNKIKYIAVEDEHGGLVGLLTSRKILNYFNKIVHHGKEPEESIESIMTANLITVTPDTKISEAIVLMQKYQIGCVPVVKSGKLVGMLTEQDFLKMIDRLIRSKI